MSAKESKLDDKINSYANAATSLINTLSDLAKRNPDIVKAGLSFMNRSKSGVLSRSPSRERSLSPITKRMSPVKRQLSPMRRSISPHAVNYRASPLRRPLSPMTKRMSPIKNVYPMKRPISPVRNKFAMTRRSPSKY